MSTIRISSSLRLHVADEEWTDMNENCWIQYRQTLTKHLKIETRYQRILFNGAVRDASRLFLLLFASHLASSRTSSIIEVLRGNIGSYVDVIYRQMFP